MLYNKTRRAEYNRRYRRKNREAAAAYSVAYRSRNRKRLLEYSRKHYADNKERYQAYRARNKERYRVNRLKRYGLTVQKYSEILVSQNGGCAICGHSEHAPNTFPVVDHCHITGRVRGLLCHHCNTLLGHSRDRPSILRKAAEYLEQSTLPPKNN